MPQYMLKIQDQDKRPYIAKILKKHGIDGESRRTSKTDKRMILLNNADLETLEKIFKKQLKKNQLIIYEWGV